MTTGQLQHGTFTITREYPTALSKVFAAFSDPKAKRRWFVDSDGFKTESYEMDFREGGFERARGFAPDGSAYTNDTLYHDIVPGKRIVFSYVMTWKGMRISASLTSIEFAASGAGTKLTYTEHDIFFEGGDGLAMRQQGCAHLLETLATELEYAG